MERKEVILNHTFNNPQPLKGNTSRGLKTLKMAHANTAIQRLADIIQANPECKIEIDNDSWYLSDKNGNEIANSERDDLRYETQWYGHSSNYGFGIAEALVELLNRQGFNIEASAV